MHTKSIAFAAAVVALTTVSASAAGDDGAVRFSKALYRSYVMDMDAKFSNPGLPGPDRRPAWTAKWLTPHFRKAERALGNATDTDQIIQAQDYCKRWATDIEAKVVSSDRDATMVAITLGAHSRGWMKSLILRLKRQGKGWLLDGVSNNGDINGEGGCG